MRRMLAREAIKFLMEGRIMINHQTCLHLNTPCSYSTELIASAKNCTLCGLLFLAGSKYDLVERVFTTRSYFHSYEDIIKKYFKEYFPEDPIEKLMIVPTYKEKDLAAYKRIITSHASTNNIKHNESGIERMFLMTPKEGCIHMLRAMIKYDADWVKYVI